MPQTITYSDLRRGMILELDGDLFTVVDFRHVLMQQRTPTLSLKVRQIKSGKTFERNMPGYTKLTVPDTETKEAQYLYTDGQDYIFMDNETFEQFPLSKDLLGDQVKYLKENTNITLLMYKGQPVTITLPNTVDLVVTDAPPGYKGDTAQGGRKAVTLETGIIVNVPMHVQQGAVVRVDTRTGEYVSLVK
jgi:elongation factor P